MFKPSTIKPSNGLPLVIENIIWNKTHGLLIVVLPSPNSMA